MSKTIYSGNVELEIELEDLKIIGKINIDYLHFSDIGNRDTQPDSGFENINCSIKDLLSYYINEVECKYAEANTYYMAYHNTKILPNLKDYVNDYISSNDKELCLNHFEKYVM